MGFVHTVSVTIHDLASENLFVTRVKKSYRLADINKPIKAELTLRGKPVSGIYGITGVENCVLFISAKYSGPVLTGVVIFGGYKGLRKLK